MIIKNKIDEFDNFVTVFDQAYEIKKIRQIIRKQKFTVNVNRYRTLIGEFRITNIKKLNNYTYSVNIKIKGETDINRYWYQNPRKLLYKLEEVKNLSDVRNRNNIIRQNCNNEVSSFLKYFSVPDFYIKIGNITVCDYDSNL